MAPGRVEAYCLVRPLGCNRNTGALISRMGSFKEVYRGSIVGLYSVPLKGFPRVPLKGFPRVPLKGL